MQVFDHHTEEFAQNWREIYGEMRDKYPVAHTDTHGGFTLFTRYEDCKQILNTPDAFVCSRSFDDPPGVKGGVTVPQNPVRMGMMEMDPPESTGYRRVLAPRFSAKAVKEYTPRMQEIVTWTVDRIIENGQMDLVDDLANPLPAMVSLDYFGLPLENCERYATILHKAVYREPCSLKQLSWLVSDLERIVAERRAEGIDTRDDVVNARMKGEARGEPVSDAMVVELLFMILNGGIDTSTALISHMFLYLDEHPDLRARLAADFSLIPGAVDEMLRFVTPGPGLVRTVVRPIEVGGKKLEPGERVFLAFGSANADAEIFPNGDSIDIERDNAGMHLSFGSGVHRCLGSFVAPAEMIVLLEEVLRRMPDYRIDRSKVQPYPTIPLVNGFMRMLATFTPGPRELEGFDEYLPVRKEAASASA